ncbi:YbaK/EbsC family protein [Candidatus Parvarchaeota archaeon]|nr:YbaK/EbsC family protein [Candidatus Parvarchaeota archaeon]
MKTQQVVDFFKTKGLFLDYIQAEKSTASSQEAASVIGCSTAEIAKSIIFEGNGNAILVLLEGDKKVDIEKLEKEVNFTVKKADPSFILQKTGFEVGGVAPIPNEHTEIYLDRGIMKHEFVWASAGSKTAVIKLRTKGLENALNAEIISVSL